MVFNVMLRRSLRQMLPVAVTWRTPGELASATRSGLRFSKTLLSRGPRQGGASARKIVMLVISNLRIDPRVEREARALASAGFEVKVLWPDEYEPRHADAPLDWGAGVDFRPLPPSANRYIATFPWLLGDEMLEAASEERPFAYHCHDLSTALVGLAAARRTGAFCVCDFHEWYSENVSWDAARGAWGPHPPLKKGIYRAAERLALKRADAVISVCDSILDDLASEFGAERDKLHLIRNIPPLNGRDEGHYPPMRAQVQVPDDHFLLLWQGGTGPARMIEPIIEALAFSPKTTLVIRGPSLDLFGQAYMDLAERIGARDRLILLPPVRSADVVAAARGADAGIWTLPNLTKNFYYALPNKIFEYMASGLPVLAANYPEARKLVEGSGVGLCFDPYSPRSIAEQINRLSSDAELRTRMQAAIPRALEDIDADREWQKLVRLYDGLEAGTAR